MAENDEPPFDARIREHLGAYVYALRDPRTREIFYIGKAGGWGAQGNQRVLDHFAEAKAVAANPDAQPSAKVQRILEIWAAGHEVEWFVVRRGLRDEAEAFHVEAALIDLLIISSAPDPLNAIEGIRGEEHGLLDAGSVRRLAAPRLGAEGVPYELAGRPILIFNIQKALAERKVEAYEATRSAWKVGPAIRERPDVIAVGLAASISRGAWKIGSWEKTGDRWCFTGREVEGPLARSLEPRNFHAVVGHESVRGYWQRGNPIMIELSVDGAFRVLSGSPDRATWRPLAFRDG